MSEVYGKQFSWAVHVFMAIVGGNSTVGASQSKDRWFETRNHPCSSRKLETIYAVYKTEKGGVRHAEGTECLKFVLAYFQLFRIEYSKNLREIAKISKQANKTRPLALIVLGYRFMKNTRIKN